MQILFAALRIWHLVNSTKLFSCNNQNLHAYLIAVVSIFNSRKNYFEKHKKLQVRHAVFNAARNQRNVHLFLFVRRGCFCFGVCVHVNVRIDVQKRWIVFNAACCSSTFYFVFISAIKFLCKIKRNLEYVNVFAKYIMVFNYYFF